MAEEKDIIELSPTDGMSSEEPKALPDPEPELRTFSWSYWLILTAITASLFYYFIRRTADATADLIPPPTLLDGQFGFTASEAYETLTSLGTRGRNIYKEINRVDFIVAPIVFREFFLNTFPATSPRSDIVRDAVSNAYFLGDLLENVCVAIMLKTYPHLPGFFVWAGCAGNVVKNLGCYASLLSILYEGFVWGRGKKLKSQ